MVVAALLAAWELIGISLTSETDAATAAIEVGGMTDVRVSFDSPESAVYILIGLLIYFAIRFETIWWHQTDDVRVKTSAQWDHWMTHGLAAGAMLIWTAQVFGPRAGELLANANVEIALAISAAGMALMSLLLILRTVSATILSKERLRFARERTELIEQLAQVDDHAYDLTSDEYSIAERELQNRITYLDRQIKRTEQIYGWLGAAAAGLGLVGTVLGMIVVFQTLAS